MKKLIIITGDLASGKSTFADIVGKKFNIPVFHKDSIKEVLSETFSFKDRAENLKLSKATMDFMKHVFGCSAKAGKDLILEANYHSNQLKEMFELADKFGYSYLTITLEGNIDILYERYIKRMKQEKRHPVHLSTDFDVKENFVQYVQNTRLPKTVENVLKLNADSFDYQNDINTINIIEEFLKD